MKRRILIQGMLVAFAFIFTVSLSGFIFPHWEKEFLDEITDIIGIALVMFGYLFRIAARGYKEEQSSQGRNLVKDGPYGLIRHPMYFGTLLIGTGIITTLLELWAFPLFLIVYLSIYIPQIKKEESILSERFRLDYEEYSKTIPIYFPKLKNLLNLKTYMSIKKSWIKKEISSFITAIAVILIIESLVNAGLFGYFDYKACLSELLELLLIVVSFVIIILILFRKKVTNYV